MFVWYSGSIQLKNTTINKNNPKAVKIIEKPLKQLCFRKTHEKNHWKTYHQMPHQKGASPKPLPCKLQWSNQRLEFWSVCRLGMASPWHNNQSPRVHKGAMFFGSPGKYLKTFKKTRKRLKITKKHKNSKTFDNKTTKSLLVSKRRDSLLQEAHGAMSEALESEAWPIDNRWTMDFIRDVFFSPCRFVLIDLCLLVCLVFLVFTFCFFWWFFILGLQNCLFRSFFVIFGGLLEQILSLSYGFVPFGSFGFLTECK